MSNLNRRPVRRAAVGVLAGTVAFTGAALGVGVSPANALPGFDFDRLSGNDRYGTAAEIATSTFPLGNDTVVIASGFPRNFPDALTGNYLAGALDAPILLTAPTTLPAITSAALAELEVSNVVIVGETDAVSAEVEAELDADYNVTRIGGADRYRTAEELVREVAFEGSAPTDGTTATATAVGSYNGLRTAVLGNGQDFPDILAAGPLGYAEEFPILITPAFSDDLEAGAARLIDELDIEQVIIVGGPAAVSTGAEEDAEALTGRDAIRLAGTQRFQTAVAIADFAYDELGFDESHVNLARSNDFADALAGGPHAGEELAPIVITPPDTLHPATEAFLNARACTLADGHIFGGFVAISPEVAEFAEDAAASNADCPAEELPDTIDVAPDATETATVTANTDAGDGSTADDRTFTASGLFAGETYRVTLVVCDNVRTDAQGNLSFLAEEQATSSTGFAAVTGSPSADITSVNGTATTDSDTATATVAVGTTTFVASGDTATFTIDGDQPDECVVPVVYFNDTTANELEGGDIPRLEVQGPAGGFGAPAEDVDVGGATIFVAAAVDTTGPTFVSATVVEGTRDVTVVFSEAVDCTTVDTDARDFSLTLPNGTTTVFPTAAACTVDGDTITVTFGNGTAFTLAEDGSTLNAVDGQIVADLSGNDQDDADEVTLTVTAA